ncbi:hypothetical protein Tco_0375875, partial [Tanacetum coccineum]
SGGEDDLLMMAAVELGWRWEWWCDGGGGRGVEWGGSRRGWWRSDGDGGVGCGGTAAGEEKRRVEESEYDERVDRVTRKLFEAHRKTPPEKFSTGGDVVAAAGRRWDAGNRRGEREYCIDGGGVTAMVVLVAVGQQPEERKKRRVEESEYDERIDRVTRKLFEAHRKTPPEKFSGGGDVVAAAGWRWAAGNRRGERDLEEVEDFHTEDGEIEDDILREKLSKINLLIAKIEAINSNPPPSSDFVTKSSSTSLNFFLEETNTFDNSIPESETFCFDLEEISSGSSNILVRIILFRIISFYFDDDQIEEKE